MHVCVYANVPIYEMELNANYFYLTDIFNMFKNNYICIHKFKGYILKEKFDQLQIK